MWKGNVISWQTSTSGSVTGSGGAPDGDEWFAAALVFAHNRWGDTSGKFDYGMEARKTLDLVRTTDFSPTEHLVRYFTGSDSNGTDASYMLPDEWPYVSISCCAQAQDVVRPIDRSRLIRDQVREGVCAFMHAGVDEAAALAGTQAGRRSIRLLRSS